MLDVPLQDLRYALRQLRRSPGFTAVALLTLALGIGATTSIFSVVDASLLRPLPYPDQDRVLSVASAWQGSPRAAVSPAEYLDYRAAEGSAFAALGAYATDAANLVGSGEPVRLRVGYASAGVLTTLGVRPALGRTFGPDEGREQRSVVLISHGLWAQRFGSAPDVVGRDITLDGRRTEIIGVLPRGFRLPADYADGEATEAIVPLGLDPAEVTDRGSHFLRVVGRMAPGVTRDRAQAALSAIATGFQARFPDDYPRDMHFAVTATPVAAQVTADARLPLLVLLGAAAIVLLVACANVAGLLLVRLEGRRRELAVRSALGAGRGRIVRQLLAESLVLGGLGGAAGVGLAWAGMRLLVSLRPPGLPRFGEVSLDLPVLGFAAATAAGTGLVFGVLPAFRAAGGRPASALRDGTPTLTAGPGRLRRGLVVGQVAMALTLLAGAGLLGRTLLALRDVEPGFRPDHVLTGRLTLSPGDYPTEPGVVGTFETLRRRVAAIPGVAAVGAVSNLPLGSSLGDLNFRIEGRPVPRGEVSPRADWQVVTPGYFRALGMNVRRGRALDERDAVDAPGAVVIDRTMAERYWPGEDPLGARFVLGGEAGPGIVTVVGVVDDVRHESLAAPRTSQMYLAHAQFRFWNGGSVVRSLTLAVRTEGDPAGFAAAVRRAVHDVDPRLPLSSVRTMDRVVAASLGRQRVLLTLAGVFAAVALVLGALGLYGVIAHGVSSRTREIGLRLALGAGRRDVAAPIALASGRLVATGLALGLAGAVLLSRLVRGLLFGVDPLDPVTLGGAALVLAMAAALATWVPARRAARLDPMEALRHE
ncbi:MAG TPA: ABC transporter permease [Gemmatimonadota bacterium]|nr:ABC transporter permease [Gemmatimonadota bacterium]